MHLNLSITIILVPFLSPRSRLYREYPEYRFHFLRYPRLEYLDLGLQEDVEGNGDKETAGKQKQKQKGDRVNKSASSTTDFVEELLFSMANLHVAAEAQGFVGTLSSNWCMMVSA